ncbi:MAG TPA: 50S ribosomal protein L15 [Opitutales bacterium]|nr:50S ribosomal protein L15 [Opitutales bacterium]
MKLHQLTNTPGSTHRRRRVGCGVGSGHGHTCGRGNKGMKARSGGGVRPGYEGGQMPLYRKLPIRGFSNFKFHVEYALVNVGDLGKISAKEIDAAALAAAGLIRKNDLPLKVLGTGEVTRAFTVKAHKFSGSAREKIEKAGGKVVELAPVAAAAKAAEAK